MGIGSAVYRMNMWDSTEELARILFVRALQLDETVITLEKEVSSSRFE